MRTDKWKILLIAITIIAIVIATFETSLYAKIVLEKENITDKYEKLEDDYILLNSSYNSLNSSYNSLQLSYSNLQQNYQNLNNDYNHLLSNHSSLQEDYTSLQNDYNNLMNDYNSLMQERNSLVDEWNDLVSDWNSLIEMIDVRYGINESMCDFITPEEPKVVSAKNNIISSDNNLSWEDMNTINEWVYNNVKYNNDTFIDYNTGSFFEEFWEYPNETLQNGFGDCEEHANLMVSLSKAEEDVGYLWCAYVTLVTGSVEEGHICVFVNVDGDRMYIYDPTWNWHSGSSESEQSSLNQYITENGFDEIIVNAIYDEQNYYSFANNQEFFDFF